MPTRCNDVMGVTDVKVYVGNAGPFLYACIQYKTDGVVNIGLIVGIVVGLGVLLILILLVVFIVVCVRKRRGKEKKTSAKNSDLEMSPVTAKRHPLNGRRVEWSALDLRF